MTTLHVINGDSVTGPLQKIVSRDEAVLPWRDAALAAMSAGDHVMLWFEPDLDVDAWRTSADRVSRR